MFQILFRGFAFMFVVMWYTLGVWKIIDEYFRTEMKRQLDVEYNENKYLKPDLSLAIMEEFKRKEECMEKECSDGLPLENKYGDGGGQCLIPSSEEIKGVRESERSCLRRNNLFPKD